MMGIVRLPVTLLIVIGVLLCLGCQKPALLIIDPASEYFFSLQGYDAGSLKGGATRAGFDLTILPLKQDKPWAGQIEQSMSVLGTSSYPVIFPPALSHDAQQLASQLIDDRVRVLPLLSEDLAPWTELGKRCGQFAKRQKSRKISFCTTGETPRLEAELSAFREAFALAGGAQAQLDVRTLPPKAEESALHELAAVLRSPVPDLTVFNTGENDYSLVAFLENWPGHFVAPDLTGLTSGLPLAVAGITHDWSAEVTLALRSVQASPDSEKKKPSTSRFIQFNDYLDK